MMYEFHKGDVKTVEKYRWMERRAGNDRKTNESINDRSLQSSKGRPPSDYSNDDINPKLSLNDTPVSGVKILKPGSRKRQESLNSTSPLVYNDRVVEGVLDAGKDTLGYAKIRTEVRFRNDEAGMEMERRRGSNPGIGGPGIRASQGYPLKSSISPRLQTNRTQTETRDEVDGRIVLPLEVGQMGRSMNRDETNERGNMRGKGEGREGSKSQDFRRGTGGPGSKGRSERDFIRKDSINRIKRVTSGSVQGKNTNRTDSVGKNEGQLADRFFFLRAPKSREKISSRNGSAEPRRPLKETISTQDLFINQEEPLHARNNTEMKIDEVSDKRKELLHDWLKDLGYLKYYSRDQPLSEECKNGSLFFKLINHIERGDVLKGENTSSKTAIRINFEKLFRHLKKFEKFNPRYLNSEYYVMKGQKDVFWGLVDDIRHVYGNKISRKDKRFSSKSRLPSVELKEHRNEDRHLNRESTAGLSYSASKGESRSASKKQLREESADKLSVYSQKHLDKSKKSIKDTQRSKSPIFKMNQNKKSQKESQFFNPPSTARFNDVGKIHKIPSYSRFVDLENTTNPTLRKARIDMNNLAELEADCKQWFQMLGYRLDYTGNIMENPLKNGWLLACITSTVFKKPIKQICKEPKSMSECRNNIEAALNIMRANQEVIPYELLWQGDEIIKGNPAVVWQLFSTLKYLHQTNLLNEPKVNLNKAANLSSVNVKTLPYTEPQIKQLGDSLVSWSISMGVFNTDLRLPNCIEDLVELVSQGAVLSKMIYKISGKVLRGLHLKPICRPNYVHNVCKCLDFLKTLPTMSRKFLWKVEDIVDRDKLKIIGLLEDLHLFADGRPQRKDPHYFEDGPYITQHDSSDRRKREDASNISNNTTGNNSGLGRQISDANGHLANINKFKLPNDALPAPLDDQQILDIINNKPHSTKSALPSNTGGRTLKDLMEEKPQAFEVLQMENTFGSKPQANEDMNNGYASTNDLDFDQVKRVIKVLLLVNMPKVVERESWNSNVWSLFSDG